MPHITNKSHSFKADKSENHVTPTTRFRSLKYNHFLSAVNTWRQCQRPALSVAEQPRVYYVSHQEHVCGYVGLLAMHQLLPRGVCRCPWRASLRRLNLIAKHTNCFDLFTTLIGKNLPETTLSARFKRYQVFVKYTFALVILGSWDEAKSPKDTKRQNHLTATACSSCCHLVTNISSSTLSSDFRVISFHTLNASQFNRNSSFIFMNLLLLHFS